MDVKCAIPLLATALLAATPDRALQSAVAIYAGPRGEAAKTVLEDPATETFLMEAEILSVEEIGSGVTRPKRLVLRLGKMSCVLALKSGNEPLCNPIRTPMPPSPSFSTMR